LVRKTVWHFKAMETSEIIADSGNITSAMASSIWSGSLCG
jgi:hypothetical protein